jgi:hypothetical protein
MTPDPTSVRIVVAISTATWQYGKTKLLPRFIRRAPRAVAAGLSLLTTVT